MDAVMNPKKEMVGHCVMWIDLNKVRYSKVWSAGGHDDPKRTKNASNFFRNGLVRKCPYLSARTCAKKKANFLFCCLLFVVSSA